MFTEMPLLESDLELDRRLIGTWVNGDGDSMTIVPHGANFLKVTDIQDGPNDEPEEIVFTTGKVGGNYLIITVLSHENAPITAVYMVAKYKFLFQTQLIITQLDMHYVERLIEQGVLAGTVTNGCPKDEKPPDPDANTAPPGKPFLDFDYECPMIDVDARELRPLLKSDEKLFPDDDDLILTRAPS